LGAGLSRIFANFVMMKKPLDYYIARLLYRYDLVTVPGFGTFVSRRKPAYYQEDEQTFFPPSKALTFNLRLRADDGLLADELARAEGIDRTEAMEMIRRSVDEWLAVLNREGRLYLESLGTFLFTNGQLKFVSLPGINFLPEAYGLHPLLRNRRTVEMSALKPAPAVKTASASRASVLRMEPEPAVSKWWQAAAAAVILMGGIWAWYAWNHRNMPAGQSAGYTVTEALPPVKIHKADKPASSSMMPASETVTPENAPDQAAVYLIAGAFRYEDNARKLYSRLKEAGYPARLVGRNAKGLYLVAIDSAADEVSARRKSRLLRRQGYEVWLLKK